MRLTKRTVLLTAVLFTIVATASAQFLGFFSTKKPAEDLTVLDHMPNNLWYMKGHRNGTDTGLYMPIGDRLSEAIQRNDTVIWRYYCQRCVNPYNNTLFVVLKNADDSVKAQILDIMKPDAGVTVVFWSGSATKGELDGWMDGISGRFSYLDTRGVRINSMGASSNATILIGIQDMTSDKVGILREELVKIGVPLGLVIVFDQLPAVPV